MALAKVTRLQARPRLTVAGRTDAGVHARGQVAHVDLESSSWRALPGRSDREPAHALAHRLNAVLQDDIVIRRVRQVSSKFDARFSALWRRYEYLIADSTGQRDPLTRNRVLWHRKPLDATRMNAAAAQLLGEHDFAAFCKPREGATTIRGLTEFSIERRPDGLIRAHLLADAFCHSMVRALIGAMIAVGEGRHGPEWPAQVLARRVRDSSVQVAPAHGLSLEEVAYPETEAGLVARSSIARQVRTLASEDAD